jgi:hypothetical protein
MKAFFDILNENVDLIGNIATIATGVAIIIFFWGIARIGRADERAYLIVTKIFRELFTVQLVSFYLLYRLTPSPLHSMHQWFPFFFSITFIVGAIETMTKSRIK